MMRVGGIAAVMAAGTLMIGIGGFASRNVRLRPWLTVLFGINGESGDVSRDSLKAIQAIDIALLLLAGVTFMGFWPGPGTHQVAWMLLTIALPFAGIPVLFATRLAGRSALMGGAVVLSILMIVGRGWTGVGYLGLAASGLLLVGDFGTGRPSRLIATIIGTGYLSLVGWFLWLGTRLLSGQH